MICKICKTLVKDLGRHHRRHRCDAQHVRHKGNKQ